MKGRFSDVACAVSMFSSFYWRSGSLQTIESLLWNLFLPDVTFCH